MKKNISILGTGWLGFPLAQSFIEKKYSVKGSTTSEDKLSLLSENNIKPYHITVEEIGPQGNFQEFLSDSETLIMNIPPGLRRNPKSNFIAKMSALIPFIENSDIKKVLFISSTSVFADKKDFPAITSATVPDATSNSGKQLIASEQLLQSNPNFETTILRFGGLYDQRRHPATMLSKRSNIKNPMAPVNLIHLEDCLGIIHKILEMDCFPAKFNAAGPDHPTKTEYYSKVCKKMELPIPDYDYETPSVGKIILSNAIVEELAYTFNRNLRLDV